MFGERFLGGSSPGLPGPGLFPVSGFSLFIAGFELKVSSPDLPVLFEPRFPYAAFAALSPPNAGFPAVDVRLGRAATGGVGEGEKVFDAGTWSLRRRGRERLISFHAPGLEEEPFWTARLGPRAREADVACRDVKIHEGAPAIANPVHYPLDQLILIHALGPDGILVHAAGARLGDRGLILAGASGAGKTTLSRLVEEAGFTVASDDRVAAARGPGGWTAWGTPWPGEGRQALNEPSPLRALVFLARGRENTLRRLEPPEALRCLMPLASVFWHDPDLLDDALAASGELCRDVPAYEFSFTPDRRAAEALAGLAAG